jgi:multidrug efflux system membrane fusion protein
MWPAKPRPAAPDPAHSQRGRGLGWAVGLIALALLGWLVWRSFFTASAPPKAATPPVPVRTATVGQQTVPVARPGVGTVAPLMSVTVRTRVDGQLDSVAFTEGQDVQAGQALARIDPRGYKAQLDQALAQKARDEALLANARVDLARYEDLIKEDATTEQTLATQRALVRQLQAAVQTDEAQIEMAQVNLGYTTIAAPIAGRVGARLVDPGNIVHAADPGGLLVINQIDPIAVQFTLPEASFQALNQAVTAARRANAAPPTVQALDRETREVLASGQLALLNNQIDASTGTIMLKARFANPQHKLWPGQSVDARIVLGESAQAITVPAPVVQRGQNGMYAYVIDADGKASTRPIQIDAGNSDARLVVVTQGLTAGERVVSDGQYRLTPGARVVEVQAGAAGAASAPAGAKNPASQAQGGDREAAR